MPQLLAWTLVLLGQRLNDPNPPAPPEAIRVATFNASLSRAGAGELVDALSTPDDPQARRVAEVVQRVRPDVLLLNEFDHDPEGRAASLFRLNYLATPQNGADPITFPYSYTGPVNAGVPSGRDLDGDGRVVAEPGSRGYGDDCLGFGQFPGQYGMVVYSRFPIDRGRVRDFRGLLWKDMPGALLPTRPDGSPWYPAGALGALRLSSKAHWDVPVRIGGVTLHVLASHPTPPAFDGPEDRNGRRNHDEIRLWADYLAGGERAAYLAPEGGAPPEPPATFVVLGDLNADPRDGGAVAGAIQQLLGHPKVDASVVPRSEGAAEASRLQGGANAEHRTPAGADTADFDDREPGNLRVDYVLPSRDLQVLDAGVFWPASGDDLARLVRMEPRVETSDHRLVWLDLKLPPPRP
jgi:3-phytase